MPIPPVGYHRSDSLQVLLVTLCHLRFAELSAGKESTMDNRHISAMEDFPTDLPLSTDALYGYELNFVTPRVPYSTEHDALVEQARQGDKQAREQIILLCLHHVAKVAHTFYWTLNHGLYDLSDLIAIGNLALVERLDYALSKDQPFPFLYISAEREIWTHCRYHSELVDLPEQYYIKDRGPLMMSLDEPVGYGTYGEIVDAELALRQEGSGKRVNPFLGLLDNAIATELTPLEREVVELKYGLRDEQEPLTHLEISRKLGRGPTSSTRSHWRAVSKLRRYLERFVS
jgi:RNA polymerase sigma factor (sigma-70 family)